MQRFVWPIVGNRAERLSVPDVDAVTPIGISLSAT